ncbi:30S ribosomal protein S19 [Candidatus Woesearchaeota archaeon]|nr:30S ribosomal protein S19 [Candidatus Woesearchaeota archaeon]
MVKKEFIYRGKTEAELKTLSLSELALLLPARARRSIKRGFNDYQKALLKKIKSGDKNIKTHCHDILVLPEMFGQIVKVYNGKEWQVVSITPDMIGHYLGEFILTRKPIKHNAPGIGATRSSASASVR